MESVLLDVDLPSNDDPSLNGNRLVAVADTIVIDLPFKFWEDHKDRDLISGNCEKVKGNVVSVRLDKDAYNEILSDAKYYASFIGEDFSWNRGLCLSAKATVKKLKAVEF